MLNTIPRYAQPLPRKPMARIHAHRKGKSGSTRPYLKTNPEWVTMEKAEIEETIVRLHQEGLSTASIGVRLRDAYGVPNVHLATGRSVTEILSSKGTTFTLPEDLASLIKRAASLQTHLKDHRHDLSNRRGPPPRGIERALDRERHGIRSTRSPRRPSVSGRRPGPPQADPRLRQDRPCEPALLRRRRGAGNVRRDDDVAFRPRPRRAELGSGRAGNGRRDRGQAGARGVRRRECRALR